MTKPDQVKNTTSLSAKQFLKRLELLRPLNSDSETGKIMSVPMGKVFALAKEFMGMSLDEIENLLESPVHEGRVGAVSIMDFEARNKNTSESRRKELFDLYIHRHDLINTWDLVDRSAPYVVGGYLFDKSREILYKLAGSKNMAERRTAIVSTYFFIRQNDLEDTFKIAEILVNDKDELIQMAVGGWIREAGKRDVQKLLGFLDKYAATMPRITLRYAIKHLDKEKKCSIWIWVRRQPMPAHLPVTQAVKQKKSIDDCDYSVNWHPFDAKGYSENRPVNSLLSDKL